jgi:hypothetical protein
MAWNLRRITTHWTASIQSTYSYHQSFKLNCGRVYLACPQPAATLGAPITDDCLFLDVKIQSSFSNILKHISPQIWRLLGLKEETKLPVLFW